MITLLSFLVTVAWVPIIPGMALTPRWALLSIIVPAGVLWKEVVPDRPRQTTKLGQHKNWPPLIAGAILLSYALISVTWATSLPDAVGALIKLTTLAGLVYIGTQLTSLEDVFVGAALGMGVSSALIILEIAGLDILQQKTQLRPGLFFNPNIVTETATLIFLGCLGLRLYWPLLLVAPALLLTHSRGGMAALGVGLLWWFWKKSPLSGLAFAALTVAIVATGYAQRSEVPMHDRYRAGVEFNTNSVKDRLAVWDDTLKGLTWLGTGIGSFRSDILKAPYRYETIVKGRTDHAHNDFLEVAYELGIVGALGFVSMLWLCLRRRDLQFVEAEKLVLLAFSIEALVQFPLHMPVTASLAALCVGRLSRSG